ncbi:MAG: hypothetical protein PVJ72_11465 [Gammaproteobacteria bacterium]|jgi:ATP-dependent protease HslVU (ClpYQ) ATPase subunit
MRNTAMILLTAVMVGCVTVKMPEHMVSDAVDAGKDLYQSVKEKMDKEEDTKAAENIYAALYSADENTTIKEAKARCLEKAIEKAKSKLNRQEINTEVVSEEVKSADQEFVVVCEVKVID